MTKKIPGLILYTTLGCHLCEQAYELLIHLRSSEGFSVKLVDIADSEALVQEYGIRIPVIRFTGLVDSQLPAELIKPGLDERIELSWPFDIDELRRWLQLRGPGDKESS